MTTSARAAPAEAEDLGWSRSGADTRSVAQVMLRDPAVLPAVATLDRVLDLFASAHVHMVVLTDRGRVGDQLTGTLLRTDLPAAWPSSLTEWTAQSLVLSSLQPPPSAVPAATWARLLGRTIHADVPAQWALRHLRARGLRRAAVVDDDSGLLGLLCVKRHGRGFCSEDSVLARRRDPHT